MRTIIDLRNPHELAIDPHPFAGADLIDGRPRPTSISLEDETDADARALIDTAETVPAIYQVLLDRSQARIGAIVEAIAA